MVLFPRVNHEDRITIKDPAVSLLVYNLNTGGKGIKKSTTRILFLEWRKLCDELDLK
jgi:hypothetical protein